MSYNAIKEISSHLKNGLSASNAIEKVICEIEDYPFFKSVGYGGLPNENCEVECDAAFMDGDTFAIGGVAGVKNIKNPIKIARLLSKERWNSFLVGTGAEQFAQKNNFQFTNMLTLRAKEIYNKRLIEIKEKALNPYDGHDTVGVVCLDEQKSISVGTSTSGLFMKKPGRVGDSPLSGSGFYADSEIGGASATGLGEDLMKGCLSFKIVENMRLGMEPQLATDNALFQFHDKLKKRYGKVGAMSVIALNHKGEWGVSTNVEFSFVVASEENGVEIYIVKPNEKVNGVVYQKMDENFIKDYLNSIQSNIE